MVKLLINIIHKNDSNSAYGGGHDFVSLCVKVHLVLANNDVITLAECTQMFYETTEKIEAFGREVQLFSDWMKEWGVPTVVHNFHRTVAWTKEMMP